MSTVDASTPENADHTDGVVIAAAAVSPQRLAWGTWALFTGMSILLAGMGLFATLIAVRAEVEAFGTVVIGAMSAAYYTGFMVGSRLTLRALGQVGHIRVWAALASLLAVVIGLAGVAVHPVLWILLRFIAGCCISGQYIVAESWLHQLATNTTRGRLLAVYGMLTVVTYASGQMLIGTIDVSGRDGFTLAAILLAAAVVPVTLSVEATPPPIVVPERMPLRRMWSVAPTGMTSTFVIGVITGGALAFAPIYAQRSGLGLGAVGAFAAVPAIGSLLLQVPMSTLSDRTDRRLVGVIAAICATGLSALLAWQGADTATGFITMGLIGGMLFTLQTIAGAYTNDVIPPEQMNAVAAQLVLLLGAGAGCGPILTGIAMATAGTDAYALMIAMGSALLAGYLMVRIIQHPPATRAIPRNAVAVIGRLYYVPATAASLGRRIRARRPRRV